jgi:hypothetical protein
VTTENFVKRGSREKVKKEESYMQYILWGCIFVEKVCGDGSRPMHLIYESK